MAEGTPTSGMPTYPWKVRLNLASDFCPQVLCSHAVWEGVHEVLSLDLPSAGGSGSGILPALSTGPGQGGAGPGTLPSPGRSWSLGSPQCPTSSRDLSWQEPMCAEDDTALGRHRAGGTGWV